MADVFNIHMDPEEDDLNSDMPTSIQRFPSTGDMSCPVPACYTTGQKYSSHGGLMLHWRKRHLPHITMRQCHLCGKKNVKRCIITKHLLKYHHVPMDHLREEISKIILLRQPNDRFCDPGEILPPRPPQHRRFVPRVDTPMAPTDMPDFYELLENFGISDPSFELMEQ